MSSTNDAQTGEGIATILPKIEPGTMAGPVESAEVFFADEPPALDRDAACTLAREALAQWAPSTPGPWRWDHGARCVLAEDGAPVADVASRADGPPITAARIREPALANALLAALDTVDESERDARALVKAYKVQAEEIARLQGIARDAVNVEWMHDALDVFPETPAEIVAIVDRWTT